MTYLKQKPGSIEDVVAKQQAQYQSPTYQKKFDEELKNTMGGIGSMTPKEKIAFFNKLDEGVSWNNIAAKFREYKKGKDEMDKDPESQSWIASTNETGKEVAALIIKYAKENKMKKIDAFNKAEREFKRLIGPDEIWNKGSYHYWDKGKALKEEWKPSTGKHADEQLMKDFIAKGGKVEKVPENKRAYNGNRIKPHLANKKNLARQEAMSEETVSEAMPGGANSSSRRGSASSGVRKKYRFGYRVAEKQPKGNDIEEELPRQLKDPKKETMVSKGGKTIVIDKSKEKEYLAKGWKLAEGYDQDIHFGISGIETQRPTEDIQEAKYNYNIKISSDYGNDGGDQEDEGTLTASSDKDAQNKADKLADKFAELWNKRKRSVGRPGGFDPVEIDVYKEEVIKKETIDAGEVSKMKDKKKEVDFKTANVSTTETIDAGEVSKMADKKKEVKFSTANVSTTEDKKEPKKDVIGSDKPEPSTNLENTIRNIWNKAANETTERGDSVLLPTRNESKIPPIAKDNKPGVKIAKIRATRDKQDGPGDGAKDPTAMEKQILTLQGQVNVLKAKLENEKGKVVKPVANKETGQVPLTVGLASKLLKDKAEKEEEDKDKVKKEAVSPYKLKYETLRARLKEKAHKEKLAKKKDEPTKGRTMTGNPASKIETDPEISYTN